MLFTWMGFCPKHIIFDRRHGWGFANAPGWGLPQAHFAQAPGWGFVPGTGHLDGVLSGYLDGALGRDQKTGWGKTP